jgi:hypothetical protein
MVTDQQNGIPIKHKALLLFEFKWEEDCKRGQHNENYGAMDLRKPYFGY